MTDCYRCGSPISLDRIPITISGHNSKLEYDVCMYCARAVKAAIEPPAYDNQVKEEKIKAEWNQYRHENNLHDYTDPLEYVKSVLLAGKNLTQYARSDEKIDEAIKILKILEAVP
jgi:hypothetical protein